MRIDLLVSVASLRPQRVTFIPNLMETAARRGRFKAMRRIGVAVFQTAWQTAILIFPVPSLTSAFPRLVHWRFLLSLASTPPISTT